MSKAYKVIPSPSLSKNFEQRFVIVDAETGAVLDNAQGYGYKSAQSAHAAWAYKHRDRSKDAELKKKEKAVQAWCKEHRDFVSALGDEAFHLAKGSCGPGEKFNAAYVRKCFAEAGFTDLPFSASEFLRFW